MTTWASTRRSSSSCSSARWRWATARRRSAVGVRSPAAPVAIEPIATSGLVATRVQLIGRGDDLASVVELCGRTRLVTLVGPGGIGKTQLAIAVAARAGRHRRLHGEVVELAPVRDEPNVVAAIATQLQVQPQQGRSVTESVLDVLGHRPLLLVLDNCEHVLDTIAGFVERLLRTCPGVRVLATSREPLALPAETVFKVPALHVAAEDSDLGPPRRIAGGRAVHAAGPRRQRRRRRPTSRPSAPWPSCAGGSTVYRWPSSWPRRALVRCRRPRSPHGWATDLRCWPARAGWPISDIVR